MCITFWTLDHPQYHLVICANRDEYLARPTRAEAWHNFSPEDNDVADTPSSSSAVLSGLDLLAKGTWLGINRQGRLAILTNYAEPVASPGTKLSRGDLTKGWLMLEERSSKSMDDYLARVERTKDDYPGFNLLLGQLTDDPSDHAQKRYDLALVSNRSGREAQRHLTGEERAGGMTNGGMSCGEAAWPKVKSGQPVFDQLIESNKTERDLKEGIWDLLSKSGSAASFESTEGLLQSIMILPHTRKELQRLYGTRLQQLILITREAKPRAIFYVREAWSIDTDVPNQPQKDAVWSGKEPSYSNMIALQSYDDRKVSALHQPQMHMDLRTYCASINLPHRLPRAPQNLAKISFDMASKYPELADVPMTYIREQLRQLSPEMLRMTTLSYINQPDTTQYRQLEDLPDVMSVTVPVHALAPTHILALWTPKSTTQRVYLLPAHGIVFEHASSFLTPIDSFASLGRVLSDCTNLPTQTSYSDHAKQLRMEASTDTEQRLEYTAQDLPLIKLCLPESAADFHLLHAYLYTRSSRGLLAALLPPTSQIQSSHGYRKAVCDPRSMNVMMDRLRLCHRLWACIVALGIEDRPDGEFELWHVLDVAWHAILTALMHARDGKVTRAACVEVQ
ncbi:uncharacterized protein L969DRAFT_100991 [Mixia osmundae IAM 14324]|uniref:DUF833-domain-containing protein n=1 Tax=Mixia osmundae (strain CBS 9802 / IAM 14324 / JCM 22182 / KY 12970) TaxID=764103 RepID=G7E301_MIXOS|nr:uncharacterized protein L969DRAFT_100991 [Mixia osmundae IAM 14324]KEI42529.1 hypothetical protein L969DRAFT_100991 [Mixia osmundae IAM 14324]GAA97182.1 hypothetical protein E5Q_03858 [Mixia osmundae IAM 14324]